MFEERKAPNLSDPGFSYWVPHYQAGCLESNLLLLIVYDNKPISDSTIMSCNSQRESSVRALPTCTTAMSLRK